MSGWYDTRRSFLKGAALAGATVAGLPVAGSAAAAARGGLDRADELFEQGDFPAADRLYRKALVRDPGHTHALAQHAYVLMLAGRLKEARRQLVRVLKAEPSHALSLRNLACTLWRLDAFEELASVLPEVKDGGPSATVGQLKSFAGREPYRIEGPRSSRVRFLTDTPLPMVEVSLNGGDPVVFFIDTGAMCAVNEDYAEQARVPTYGWTMGRTVYGDFKAYHGRADLLALGDMKIRDVPVHTLPADGPTASMRAPDGRYAKGVIGTSVLSHFLASIDYPGQALVLRKKGTAMHGAVSTPLWFAGDHFLLGHGTVNGTGPMVFLVDTGGAGTGFTAPDATYTQAGITVPPGEGPHEVTVDRLTLGRAARRDVPGRAGVFPQMLEDAFGFGIGGLITHRFFQAYTLTFDFDRMRILLDGPS
ncbi:aspartyl protease family protein [Nonomuraea sp. B1E8]|uniref:aspartyl protease family protein n=1 Tax=unclassified Nonomuraea TaxID=2593643 RepID=UPI00325F849B